MFPPEDNTMELENCQESRTKQNEEKEKMLHFLLQGELNSFPLRSCLSTWSHFLQLSGLCHEGQKRKDGDGTKQRQQQ